MDLERLLKLVVVARFGEMDLEAALDGIRDECSRLIGAGKKIVVQ